jgi:hypothetical protein
MTREAAPEPIPNQATVQQHPKRWGSERSHASRLVFPAPMCSCVLHLAVDEPTFNWATDLLTPVSQSALSSFSCLITSSFLATTIVHHLLHLPACNPPPLAWISFIIPKLCALYQRYFCISSATQPSRTVRPYFCGLRISWTSLTTLPYPICQA